MKEMQSTLHYYMKFKKFFNQHRQLLPALFGCLAVSLCVLVVIRAYFNVGPGSTLTENFTLSEHNVQSTPMTENRSSSQKFAAESKQITMESMFRCDNSNPRTDVCEMKGDVRVHGKSSKIVLVSSSEMNLFPEIRTSKIRPYARKGDSRCMKNVNELTLESLRGEEHAPSCSLKHNVPAIVFSVSGYQGNFFHDFTDLLVPLFITAYHFHGEVQFLITNYQSWWVDKYTEILEHLSKYETIDLDHDNQVRCFPSVFVGLRSHKDMGIDPWISPNGHSMYDFIRFLRSSYSLERERAIRLGDNEGRKPRLLIISRNRTRVLTNVGELEEMARGLGYEVVVGEPTFGDVSKFAHIVNSCDVMMGIHGAALTNMVFLPTYAVLIQVLPFGDTEWIANTDFGEPSKDMKIRYIDYKIEEKESSLSEEYPHDHPVLRDPSSISKQGWDAFGSIYLEKQNVKLDLGKFRNTLLHALALLHQ